MADKIELAELTEDLFCGGAAKATLLDFDRETNDWKPRPDGAIEVHESAGRCSWDFGDRLWILACEQSQRFEVLGIEWEPGNVPKAAAFSEAK